MKRILSYILTVILLCGVTVSCSHKDVSEPKISETLIMFFPYSALESYISANIRCMEEAVVNRGGLGTTRLIVYRATSAHNGTLYEITYENGTCTQHEISNVSATFDSKQQESNVVKLQTVFTKIIEYAPADIYSIIIGCHGNSWIQAGKYLGNMNYRAKNTKYSAFGTAGANNQIDNATLVAAAKAAGLHFSYLLFDACYMMSIEAAYDFRSICDYYIASQNEILSEGVPYHVVGDALLKHDYSAAIKNYVDFYTNYSVGGMMYPFGSFSVARTDMLEGMADIVKRINTTALREDVDVKSLQREDGISPTIFFDFKDYITQACTSNQLLQEFNQQFIMLLPFEAHTPFFYTAFDWNYKVDAGNSFGMDTSQPTINPQASELVKATEWWKATH